jgi:branched-chain amino acid transport system permease protein
MIDFYNSNIVLVQSTLTGLLLALSVQVPLRMGVFSFAGAGSYGLGAYTAGILVVRYQTASAVAIVIAVALCAVVGLLLGLLIFNLSGLYLAMSTVAFNLILGVVIVNGGTFTGGSTGLYGVVTGFGMAALWVVTIVALLVVAATELGRTGRRVETVREDPELAAVLGIKVYRYRLTAFVASGALGGLAGSMTVLVRTAIGPSDIGFNLVVLALTMIIVGGTRSWKGALIGAIVFTWLPNLLITLGDWHQVIYGVLVTLVAVLFPRGIHGVLVNIVRALRRAKHRRPTDSGGPQAPADESVLMTAEEASGGRRVGSQGAALMKEVT